MTSIGHIVRIYSLLRYPPPLSRSLAFSLAPRFTLGFCSLNFSFLHYYLYALGIILSCECVQGVIRYRERRCVFVCVCEPRPSTLFAFAAQYENNENFYLLFHSVEWKKLRSKSHYKLRFKSSVAHLITQLPLCFQRSSVSR